MIKLSVFLEPHDLGHHPQETFILKHKIQFLWNNELLIIRTILFQPYFPAICTKENNTWPIFIDLNIGAVLI